jgi:hypothetical protein
MRHAVVRVIPAECIGVFVKHRRGAAFDGVVNITAAVGSVSRIGKEDIARNHAARVGSQLCGRRDLAHPVAGASQCGGQGLAHMLS